MINEQTGNKINEFNWKIVLITLLFMGGILYLVYLYVIELIFWEALPIIPKWVLILMGLAFLYDRVISVLSEWLVKVFEGMTAGKTIKDSIINTIPIMSEEEKQIHYEAVMKQAGIDINEEEHENAEPDIVKSVTMTNKKEKIKKKKKQKK